MSAPETAEKRTYGVWTLRFGAIGLVFLAVIMIESICLGVEYGYEWHRYGNADHFAARHWLTSLFVPRLKIPGKDFVGYLSAGPNWRYWNRADALLGWRYAPNTAVIHRTGIADYFYMTDANGFIVAASDPPVSVAKPPGTYRVILLGGSTLMGQGAPDPSQNLVSLFRKQLIDDHVTGPHGERLEIINAGVGGYDSGQEYLYLASELLRYRPDLVITYDGWNDAEDQPLAVRYADPSPLRTDAHRELSARVQASFSTGAALMLAAEDAGNAIRASGTGMGEMIDHLLNGLARLTPQADVTFDARSVAFYKQNLVSILSLGHDTGFAVAEFLQPVSGVDGKVPTQPEIRRRRALHRTDQQLAGVVTFYEHARPMFSELKKTHLPPDSCIADLTQVFSGSSETLYVDVGHLLPRGNEIVARRMVQQLLDCRQLAQSAQ